MKLLQPEIDVVPGRRAQQPQTENRVGPGSSVLRLSNTSSQENAYTVRLKCENNAYWQDDWYVLRALPAPAVPPAGIPVAPTVVASNKPDQYGPGNRWVKIFVSAGATRDVLISFNLPQKPDSRAGQYPFAVVVETSLTGGAGAGASRRGRFTEIPAVAVVRPYHRWSVDVTPEDGRRVGLLRRGADFEVVVTNESNDWLYCDLKLPRPKDLLLASPTMRLAVPPPEPGQENFQRTIPIRGVTRLRTVRGEQRSQTLPLSAVRVDAPSVAPLDEDVFHALPSVGAGTVTATGTNEVMQAPSERALVYCPPIPSTLTGFLGAAGQNFKGLLITVTGLIVVVNLGAFMFENLYRNTIIAEPLSTTASKQKPLIIGGKFLNGARVYLEDDKGKLTPVGAKLGRPKTLDEGAIRGEGKNILAALAPADRQYLTVDGGDLDRFNGQQVRVVVQRAGSLPYMSSLLPKYRGKETVLVGKVKNGPVDSEAVAASTPKKGDVFPIADPKGALGDAPGQVLVGTDAAKIIGWRKDRIGARVPETAASGIPLPVKVVRADGQIINAGNITVLENTVVASSPVASSPSSGDSSAGSGSAAGGRSTSSASATSAGGGSPAASTTLPPSPSLPARSGSGSSGGVAARPSTPSRPRTVRNTGNGGVGRTGRRRVATVSRNNRTNPVKVATGGGRNRPPAAPVRRPGTIRPVSVPAPRGPNMAAVLSAQTAYECLLLHQYAVAREKAQQMLASNPNDPTALAVRGLALLGENRDKNFFAASSDLRAAFNQTKGQPGRAASLAALGMANLLDTTNARQRYAARRFIITALDADPALVLAATTGARFLNKIDEADRAKTVAGAAETRLAKLGGDEATVAAFDVALCYQEIGNTAKGREFMDRFKQQMPVVAALPSFVEADNRLR